MKINTEYLKKKIEEHGMNVAQFAQKVGVSRVSVYTWLNGNGQPKMSTCMRISEILNAPLEKLLEE